MKIFRSGRRLPVVQIFIKICLFLRTESNGNLFDWELWLALLQLLWVVMILCWSPGEPRWQHQPTGHYSFSDRHCCYFSSPAQLVPSHCSTWVAISCNISISYKQIINIPLLHLPFPPSPPSLSPALVRSDPWRESTNWDSATIAIAIQGTVGSRAECSQCFYVIELCRAPICLWRWKLS